MNSRGFTDEEVIKAFEETDGNYALAAKLLGITRNSLWNRVDKSPLLKEARRHFATSLVDRAENKLVKLVMDGIDVHGSPVDAGLHFKALQYFLTSKGKKRGYEGGGHRRPDVDSREDKQREMFRAMDALHHAIEEGGPPIQNGEVVGHD